MYFVGIFLIFLGALLVNRIAGYKHRKSYFIIELPEYKKPSVKQAFFSMLMRGKAYIIKAGTIILRPGQADVRSFAVTVLETGAAGDGCQNIPLNNV